MSPNNWPRRILFLALGSDSLRRCALSMEVLRSSWKRRADGADRIAPLVTVYQQLFQQWQVLVGERDSLRQKQELVVQENDRLKRTVIYLETNSGTADLASAVAAGLPGGATHPGSSVVLRMKELEDKLHHQQEELATLLRQKSLAAYDMMELTKDNRAKMDVIESLEKQLADAQKIISEQAAKIDRLEGRCSQLQKETDAAATERMHKEEDLNKMQERLVLIENSTFEKLQRNADMLNELTDENQSLRREIEKLKIRIQELEQALDRATREGFSADAGRSNAREEERIGGAYLQQSKQAMNCVPRGLAKLAKGSADSAELNCVAFGREYVATAGNDKTVKLFDPRTLDLRTTLSGSAQAVLCVSFSEDSSMILGAGNDCACRIWSLPLARMKHTLTGHTGKISGADFTTDGLHAVTGSHDRLLKYWDLSRGYCLFSMPCLSICNDTKFAYSNDVIVSAHFDGTMKVWDVRTKEKVDDWKLHSQQITSLTLSPDRTRVLSNGRDSILKLVDFRAHEELQVFSHGEYKSAVNWGRADVSPDGQYVSVGSSNGKILLWQVLGGVMVKILEEGHRKAVSAVAWSPDGSRLAACGLDGVVSLWE